MAETGFQEKTERATPKKRYEARKEGQVAKSAEVPSVLVLMAAMGMLFIFSEYIYGLLQQLMRSSLVFGQIPEIRSVYLTELFWLNGTYFIKTLMPLMAAVVTSALAANFAMVGFKITPKALQPKLSKFNLIKGLQRLLSLKALLEVCKATLKLFMIGLVAYWAVRRESSQLLQLYDTDVAAILLFTCQVCFKIFMQVLLVMAVLAAADYGYQKWQHEKDLRMTKQEIKDENKQAEGDPQVKARIRSIQLQAARRRMMQELPHADVVVTNPTHLAVALKYDPLAMGAPRVVAKGAGNIAKRIKQMAQSCQIPLLENRELARNLYRSVDVGEEIPSDLYQAVAEVLAYVYRIKGKAV